VVQDSDAHRNPRLNLHATVIAHIEDTHLMTVDDNARH